MLRYVLKHFTIELKKVEKSEMRTLTKMTTMNMFSILESLFYCKFEVCLNLFAAGSVRYMCRKKDYKHPYVPDSGQKYCIIRKIHPYACGFFKVLPLSKSSCVTMHAPYPVLFIRISIN